MTDPDGQAATTPDAPGHEWRPTDSVVDVAFRYVHRLQVRFGDLDALGHVNHAKYLTYVEQARTMWARDVLRVDVPEALRFVIATLHCDFLAPLGFADFVDVGWRLTRVGRSSATCKFELTAEGRTVGRGDTVIVWADPKAGRAVPLPDDLRRRAAEFDGLQQ